MRRGAIPTAQYQNAGKEFAFNAGCVADVAEQLDRLVLQVLRGNFHGARLAPPAADRFDFSTFGFALYFGHHGQLSVSSSSDYQPVVLAKIYGGVPDPCTLMWELACDSRLQSRHF
jgi:hypothetical protein